MATRHRPSRALQGTLAGLLARAEADPGRLQTVRLHNNLKVDVTVADGRVHLQVSRSSRYPSPSDWAMVVRHWPYPVQVSHTNEQRYGRCYLSASWPAASYRIESDRSRNSNKTGNHPGPS